MPQHMFATKDNLQQTIFWQIKMIAPVIFILWDLLVTIF